MSERKQCVISAKAVGQGDYHWAWRSADGDDRSANAFAHFYDCVTDAQTHGFTVDLESVLNGLAARRSATCGVGR